MGRRRRPNPVVSEILRQGRGRPASEQAAALETGRVESNFTNPAGGGWRQERASLYPDPTNLHDSVARFYAEARRLDHGQPSYELAAAVQRPAAQYRGRYKQAHAEALSLLGGGGLTSPASTATSTTVTTPTQTPIDTYDQAGYQAALEKQRLASFLSSQGKSSKNSVLFRTGLLSTKPVDPSQFAGTATKYGTVITTVPGRSSSAIGGTAGTGSVGSAARAVQRQFGALIENTGSNRGTALDKLEQTDAMVGQPWCGIFAGAVLKQMGVNGVGSWIASVAAIEAHARQGSGPFSHFTTGGKGARPGDLVIPSRGEHVAVVQSVDPDGTIHAIGGNNSNGTVGTAIYSSPYGIAHVR